MQSGINNNTTYSFNSSVNGYTQMYYTNSESKSKLETWYTENIINEGYSDSVASGDYYCEQAKVSHNSGYASNSGASMTLYSNYTPNFKCEDDANKKGIVNASIGLPSYDEVAYAGGYYDSANTDYYLSTIGFWTMSPVGVSNSNIARAWYVNFTGNIATTNVDGSTRLRPVINLVTNIMVTGSGTSDNPYIVVS